MKKNLTLIFLSLSTLILAASNNVETGVDVSGELKINANVLAPLEIKEQTPMEFGDIIIGKAAESTTHGQMKVEGAPGNNVIVTVPASATIERVGISGSTATVTLSSDVEGTQNLGEDGEIIHTIKGNIAEGETTKAGEHTGTVTISVKYN
ncbi:MAG: DUF4402 domain-containing protein [Fusobacterium sp. JB019]|nr:DUF4402 domain-containing protein [Fusobacterium sp. JB019]